MPVFLSDFAFQIGIQSISVGNQCNKTFNHVLNEKGEHYLTVFMPFTL